MAPGAQFTIDQRLALLDEVCIDLQVISVTSYLPYLSTKADAVAVVRLANDLYAELCSKYPRRFAAFGAVPLPHVEAALNETARCLDMLGMVGLTVGCSVADRQLDDPEFTPFFDELNRRGAVLFLHPQGAGCGPGMNAYGLRWMIGAAVEDTVAALRLIMSGWLDRYPRVRIIVPHLGGVLPFLYQRINDLWWNSNFDDQSAVIGGPPSRYYRRLWYDTVNSHPAALRCACDSLGADRLLLGTDFPWIVGPQWARLTNYVEQAGLSAPEKEAILGGNAERLLGLHAL
jgi:aminocarboxymuconate-semialdehyde decarboxylase